MLPQIGLAAWAARKHGALTFPFQLDLGSWVGLVKAGIPFGIISLTLSIAFSIDSVMMSWVLPENFVGWYSAAYGLVFSINSLFLGFRVAIVPSLTRAYANDPTTVQQWYYRSVKYSLMLSLPIAIGGMLTAYPLIRLLYADEFLPSALALQILIWDVPFIMFTSFCGNITTIIREERAAARIYTINALANVILNLYAIPRFGLVGAALVTVTTDLIGAMQFYFLLQHRLKLPNMAWILARIAAASVFMGAAVYLANKSNLFVLIGLGAAVYAVMVLVLRLLDETEWAMIRRLARKFTGGPAAKEPTS
jgi:O-antigen/teichoic acid export membrane protein